MKQKHLIVVSVDALVYEDLEYAKDLPAFGKILREGSRIDKVRTIYPSLTHPVHASIMTGCPAGITGIPANELFVPGNLTRPWYNYLDQVKCETIFHVAHAAGMTTAACRWPVTANAGEIIDYLVPEVTRLDMDGHEDAPLEVYRKLGTGENIIDIVAEAVKRYGTTNAHPDFDEFEIYCAAEIIRKFKPNVLFTHPGYVDGERHRTGLFTEMVKESVRVTDRWIGMLMDAVKDAGIEEETDFVVLSDHGQLGILRTICPNVLLADAGYIRVNEKGDVASWDAYATSCGLSAQVYLANPEDCKLRNEVYDYLCGLAAEKIYGFERVFTREEVKERYGLDGGFSFVLETDGFTSFQDAWQRPLVRELDISDYRYGHGTHGHMPEKGPQPPFLAMGPGFRKGVVIPEGDILNHAPTLARVLGLTLPQAVGTVVEELLAE